MKYVGTRDAAPAVPFETVLLGGLAAEGGLYVPESWPQLSPAGLAGLAAADHATVAAAVLEPFLGDTFTGAELRSLLADSHAGFAARPPAPLGQIDDNLWLLDLTRGPTLAFKDHALQLVGRMFDHVLARRGERRVIIGATSGDTGSAAIAACRGRDNLDIFILHPKGRVSPVQRRQMTTETATNVHNIAVEGSFDDCQGLVKTLFADAALQADPGLLAVNSINWARIAAQIVYYVTAALALGAPARPVSFAVPSGNFGNAWAAHAARRMGLPIRRLVLGSNRNDILTRTLATGEMRPETVVPTLSPSMDIQISSNFERLIFELYDRDGLAVAAAMRDFRTTGRLDLAAGPAGPDRLARLQAHFAGYRIDDNHTLETIRLIYESCGKLVDPHTAIGIAAARASRQERDDPATPMIALACADPAKFPDAVARATGVRPALPARMAGLMEKKERYVTLPREAGAIRRHILDRAARRG